MKKWLFRIFWIPVLVVAVLFLVANRQMLAISLDPFSATNPAVTTPALPLWFWLIGMLFVGVGLGSAAMWRSGLARRQQARAQAREFKALQREMEILRRQSPPAAQPSSASEPPSSEPPLIESVNA